jgi:prophage DNA circulation protein
MNSILSIATSTATAWVALAETIAADATSVYGSASVLPGNFGRFAGGAFAGFMGTARPYNGQVQTISGLIDVGAQKRAAVSSAGATLIADAGTGNWANLGADAQAVAAAVLAATVDPADGVRLLTALGNFYPNAWTTSSVIGQNMAAMQAALGNLFRRAAVTTLARASSTYQPSSSNDAVAVRNLVAALIDSELEVAGNNGEDATYNALRALRQSVVLDLNSRGAALPQLKTVTVSASLPSASLALRLYRDASRGDEIASESGAPHPAFQPTSLQVLAS